VDDFEGVLQYVTRGFPGQPIDVVGHSAGGFVIGLAESARRAMFLRWHVAMPLLARVLGPRGHRAGRNWPFCLLPRALRRMPAPLLGFRVGSIVIHPHRQAHRQAERPELSHFATIDGGNGQGIDESADFETVIVQVITQALGKPVVATGTHGDMRDEWNVKTQVFCQHAPVQMVMKPRQIAIAFVRNQEHVGAVSLVIGAEHRISTGEANWTGQVARRLDMRHVHVLAHVGTTKRHCEVSVDNGKLRIVFMTKGFDPMAVMI
jgi:hypothetical protein|tara:strand:- start:264 stop:1052 length:789 start_codon:yes stop_codon:yes gene_type:complete